MSSNGFSPLENLIRHRAPIDLINKFIHKGANVNQQGPLQRALHCAVNQQAIEIVKTLLQSGAVDSINSLNEIKGLNMELTPLHIAVASGNVQLIAILLNGGADPNVRAKRGGEDWFTPFEDSVDRMIPKDGNLDAKKLYGDIATEFIKRCKKEKLIVSPPKKPNEFQLGLPVGYYQLGQRIEALFAKTERPTLYFSEKKIPCQIQTCSNSGDFEENIQRCIEAITQIQERSLAPIIDPLVQLLYKECEENENFRIVFCDKKEEYKGCYDGMDTIYIDKNSDSLSEILVHELAHLAAERIFHDHCLPYRDKSLILNKEEKGDSDGFTTALQLDLSGYASSADKNCNQLFHREIEAYPKEKRHSEYFARIPQLAWKYYRDGMRGQKLESQLNNTIPRLYKYYMKVFTPLVVPKKSEWCTIL